MLPFTCGMERMVSIQITFGCRINVNNVAIAQQLPLQCSIRPIADLLDLTRRRA
jgi:hypothetical protein